MVRTTSSRYQIAEDIKWTLNPASGLEAQEILANIIIEQPANTFGTPTGSWILDGTDAVTGRARYRSDVFDIGCLKNRIIRVVSTKGASNTGWQADDARTFIRITANLKRTDNAPDAQNVLFTAVYPLNVQNVTTALNLHSNTPCTTLTPPQTAQQIKTFCESTTYKQGRFYTARQVKEAEEARAKALANIIQATAYPNPVSNNLQIEVTEDNNLAYEVKLYNVHGIIVYQGKMTQNRHTIDIRQYKDGFYVLLLKSDDKEVRKGCNSHL